ncbi:sugar phosphate isomerase/epimerase [Mesorhizobium sp. CGMCC 1.15528]|uniref:Sugar phosphate isomerase/epimerase n=1 Tax=Mesorhizobium zhangyense TaxID=1776730 RepID=A0A7C9VHG8_9HYPH|nr:sugar phosphate isomerase/epimerase family protein [Mesorhizobium zhangyense]NGN44651.1 sugar phosphate isomerase/epimerase [Mesorhizobium zhangyense]
MDFVFWPAAVRTFDFEGHIRAAVAGRFTHLAIDPITYRRARASGLSAADIKAMASDAGVPISHLDTFTDWAPIRVPSEVNQALRERFDVSSDECFDLCEALGIKAILAVAGYDPGAVERQRLVDGFAAMCERANAAAIWVDLEFMPFWGLPDLRSAWDIVKTADRPNSGILIDTWHFSKGAPDFDLLRSIPDRYLIASQVSDARVAQRGASLFEDTVRYREFAGEGELPIVEILQILIDKGLQNVGPEVFSDYADTLTPEEAGKRCGDTLRRVLEQAGADLPSNVL